MAKKRVLVIDDEEDICIFIKDILEREGFKVFTALGGAEAMDIFNKEKPQICLIDIHMPYSEFDGLEILKRVKGLNKKTLCVMATRIDDNDKMNKAAFLGAEQYLIKPLSMEKIKDLIKRLKEEEING